VQALCPIFLINGQILQKEVPAPNRGYRTNSDRGDSPQSRGIQLANNPSNYIPVWTGPDDAFFGMACAVSGSDSDNPPQEDFVISKFIRKIIPKRMTVLI